MLFSSITFIFIFLPATIALNLIVPERFRNVILMFASLFFYAWGEPVYFDDLIDLSELFLRKRNF